MLHPPSSYPHQDLVMLLPFLSGLGQLEIIVLASLFSNQIGCHGVLRMRTLPSHKLWRMSFLRVPTPYPRPHRSPTMQAVPPFARPAKRPCVGSAIRGATHLISQGAKILQIPRCLELLVGRRRSHMRRNAQNMRRPLRFNMNSNDILRCTLGLINKLGEPLPPWF